MRTLKFYCVEIDETSHWSFFKKPDDLKILGVYMFLAESGTYLCSPIPMSWFEWIDYVAVTEDEAWLEWFNNEYAFAQGEDSYYHSFVDIENTKLKLSRPFEIEIEEGDEPALAQAWVEAREHFQCNAPQFPN